jgi:hypothetical protein
MRQAPVALAGQSSSSTTQPGRNSQVTSLFAAPLAPSPLRPSASQHKISTPSGPSKPSTSTSKKEYTPRSAGKFKSPFKRTISGTSTAPPVFPSTRLTPAVQALEAQVQLLKRAVNIKEAAANGKQTPLDELALKWRTAGREVAKEVWELVKDNKQTSNESWAPAKREFESGWGWEKSDDEERDRERSQRQQEDHDEELESTQDNIGTMLRQLRIDPVTLGWDETEGDFVD